MAKQIIWSRRAQIDRKEILKYWINRNKSNSYSKKLTGLFKEAIKLIKIVRDYLIISEMNNEQIFILTIWDSRQSPVQIPVACNIFHG